MPIDTYGDTYGDVYGADPGGGGAGAVGKSLSLVWNVYQIGGVAGVGTAVPWATMEIAFATQPMAASPTWTDVSSYVSPGQSDQIVIVRGRTDEFSRIQASTMAAVFDNTDGRFTLGRTASPYSPNVLPGKRIRYRYSVNNVTYQRFDGHVNEFPIRWEQPTYAPVSISSTDRFKRFGEVGELHSLLEEEILRDAVEVSGKSAVYYPLGEPSGSVGVASITEFPQAVGQVVLVGTGKQAQGREAPIEFGSGTGPGTDELSAPIFAPRTTDDGAIIRADLIDDIGANGVTLGCWFRASGLGIVPDEDIVNRTVAVLSGLGTQEDNHIAFQIDATGHIHARKYKDGALVYQIVSGATYNDGQTHHAVVTETWSGGSITARFYLNGVLSGTNTHSAPSPTPVYLRLTIGGNTWDNDLFTGTISHVFACSTPISAARITDHYKAGKTGLVGDRTDQRIGRIADYIGIPTADRVFDTGDSTVGWQSTQGSAPLQAMQDVEETENGVLFMSLDGKLTFHKRSRRYNVSPFLTLNAQFAEQIGMDLEFPGDDFGLINDATANRPRNSPVRAVNRTSRDAHGLYRHTTTILDDSDTRAQSVVDWLVNTYGSPLPRVPSISIDLLVLSETNPTLLDNVLDTEISHLIRLTNLPSAAPASTIDVFVEGWTETIGVGVWTIRFNCSPAVLTGVWQLGVSGASELGVTTKLAY